MVSERSYDLIDEEPTLEAPEKVLASGFVPVAAGDAFDFTPVYLDRTYSERGIYLMGKAAGGSPRERVLLSRGLLNVLNISERGSVVAGAYLIKNDPGFINNGIAGMNPYELLRNCITVAQSMRAIFQKGSGYNLGREWGTALETLKKEMELEERREPYRQSLAERVTHVDRTDIVMLQSSLLDYRKEMPGFAPDFGSQIVRADGCKSNKAFYIKQVIDAFKGIHSNGDNYLIEPGHHLDDHTLDAIRHNRPPF